MAEKKLNKKIKNATKWSALTEVLAKIVVPLTTMLLARLLTPDAFGVVATMTMVISFADIFSDAGFNKYLIQHEFDSKEELEQCTNVAFWSNLGVSFFLWAFIAALSTPITKLVGCPGYELGLIVACMNIPLSSFSSIQTALYKRNFDFKTLFGARTIGVLIPLLITAPLAYFLRNYWALILGTVAKHLINAIYLTAKSPWKPRFYYRIKQLKQMLSFSIWTLFEAISIWLTGYADIFIVGTCLSKYYLGVYRTSMSMVAGITGIITSATTPVLFAALSRLQNNDEEYQNVFFKFQKIVSILVVPLGVGTFLFRDTLTTILLGDQWGEAVDFIGLWGLMSTITILFSHYASEVYRSKGKPRLSFIAQWLHIIVLVPVVYIFANRSFESLYVARSLVRLQSVLVDCILLYFCIKLSPWEMAKNVFPAFFASAVMFAAGMGLRTITTSFGWCLLFIAICAIVYFVVLSFFKTEKGLMRYLYDYFIGKYIKKEKKELI